MATFTGTADEFKRYVGPRLRNLVQQITKSHKATVGACEHCGDGGTLEAAHIHGRGRNQIIAELLARRSADEVVSLELGEFEARFRSEHEPVEKAILILCQPCHTRYDNLGRRAGGEKARTTQRTGEILPITLDPPGPEDFKRKLLATQNAEVLVYYADGRIDRRPWKAQKFTVTSNVIGNLRTRPEFRQGKWQAEGIVKVHARVVDGDG